MRQKLTNEQRVFIIVQLAQYNGPTEVAKAFEEEFGFKVSSQLCYRYDATRPRFDQAEKWEKLFFEERNRFKNDVDSIPIASKVIRLRRLEERYHSHVKKGEDDLASATLVLAAKELGEVFTNKRQVDSKTTVVSEFEKKSHEEQRAELIQEMKELGLADELMKEMLAQGVASGDKKPN